MLLLFSTLSHIFLTLFPISDTKLKNYSFKLNYVLRYYCVAASIEILFLKVK